MTAPNAKFVWYELLTSDPQAAQAFYTTVVGWSAKDAGMPEPFEYTLLSVGADDVAGLMAMPPEMAAAGARPAWTGYVAVDDVDAMAARLLHAGGKLLRPAMDIPGVGRFAPVADPQGASFALFKPQPASDGPSVRVPGAPGTPGWHELFATDWQKAFEFYASHFGWTKGEPHDMGPGGIYQVFEIDGVPSGGMMTAPPGMPAGGWGYYFNVDAISAAVGRIEGAGGTVTTGPMQVPGGLWIVQASDPQGAAFALVSTAE